MMREIKIEPLRHRVDLQTMSQLANRAGAMFTTAWPPACYSCYDASVPLAPWHGRVLCERCIVLEQLRKK